jgi:hypothetical protein
MGGACSTNGENIKAHRLVMGKPEGKRPLGRPRCGWLDNISIGLGEIGWGGQDWSDSGQGQVEGPCECGNEPSVSMKCRKIIEWLHNGFEIVF